MKLRFWMTITLASVLWQPAFVLAQGAQDGLSAPQTLATRSDGPRGILPDNDSALPNRRIPSLIPPHADENHPVTPAKAWPRTRPSAKPSLTSPEPDAQNKVTESLFNKDAPRLQEPFEDINETGPRRPHRQ